MNMNKLSKVLLVFCTIFGTVELSACSNTQPSDSSSAAKTFANAQEVMEACWKGDDSTDKPPVMGGYGEDYVEDKPAALNLEDAANVAATYSMPVEVLEEAQDASGMMHAMMANHFTAICIQLKEGSDVKAAADKINEYLKNNHWLCGQPEEYQILTAGSYIITCIGLKDTVDPFMESALAILDNASIAYSQTIE